MVYAEERQQAMAQQISQQGRLSVADLSTRFDVTTETVRRDLSSLERIGLIRRVHGGAVPAGSLAVMESGLSERDQANTAAKDAIAHAALALLPPPGSHVILDAGTTTMRLAAALPRDHRLSITTHAVPVAARVAGQPHLELHLLPGKVRTTTQAAVGSDTIAALADLRADVTFVASNGLTVDHGLTTPDREEAATKRAMVAAGRRIIALVDSTKISVESTIRFAALRDLDVLVTDDGLADRDRAAIEACDVEVVVA